MSQKKISVGNNRSTKGTSKRISSSIRSKILTTQTLPTPSVPSTSSANKATDFVEDTSSMQNYILFWLDSNINLDDENYRHTITQLQSNVNIVHVFNDINQCIHILNKIKRHKVLMIISNDLVQSILPRIHDIHQLMTVLVFCSNTSDDVSWTKRWLKIKGIFTDLTTLCEAIKQVARQCDEDSVDISFISTSDISSQSLDQLDQSFMYTQLIKEIFLELPYNNESIAELVTYYRNKYSGNENELTIINKFQDKYSSQSPIWWYTYECFIYHQLNWALREQEVDVIIRMAFFICDLLRHIEKLHQEQSKEFQKEFLVYRGQSMAFEKFEKLKKSVGGLLSFNIFLSTSTRRDVAIGYTASTLKNPSYVSILFIITVNPLVSSVPFANVEDVSYFKHEKEILFSMHSIFRISEIRRSDTDNQLWHVYLTSTSNSDKQIVTLIERMRLEIEGSSALYRLGALMIKLGEFGKAEEVYNNLRKRTLDELENGHIYYQLGHIKDNQGDYSNALDWYQQALQIYLG